MLKGKKIVLGITGSIAAYKSAVLTRLLIKNGAEVKVIMTSASKEFISPLTLSTLSKHPVLEDMWDESTGEWSNHVALGLWADLMLIAPATANTVAKLANGLSDNMLTSTYLSAKCPVLIAPAMDRDMYIHPSTIGNFKRLKEYGNIIIDAEEGELASGLSGQGRMAEPENILQFVASFFNDKKMLLADKHVLITSGPTFEAIDPVRFIGNHSSGKMGMALAEAAAEQGAKVTLVSGPTQLQSEHPLVTQIDVRSAEDMYQEVLSRYSTSDITVFAAAVADYRPKEIADQKIKKSDEEMSISLIKNKDIAYEMGKLKRKDQVNIGFALETENESVNAEKKLTKKNFDFIVLNSLNDKGAGFSKDTNKVTIFTKDNKQHKIGLKSKVQVAEEIIAFTINSQA